MPKELLFEVTDDVGVITFDRERARNALTLAMYEELAEISQSIIDGRDLRISDRHLRFGFPIAKTLGNCLSTRNLARVVDSLGANLAREIMLTARLIEIDEACDVKLVNQCHHDPVAQAMRLAEGFKQLAPLTLSATKEGLRRIRQGWSQVADDDLIVECYTSDDFREGRTAFLEKRKPNWTGH